MRKNANISSTNVINELLKKKASQFYPQENEINIQRHNG